MLLVLIDLTLIVKTILGRDWWIYIGPTYDNGDKTDTWFQSNVLVPAGVISYSQYVTSFGNFDTMYVLAPAGIVKAKTTDAMGMFLCVS
jgi:hypothetical protein